MRQARIPSSLTRSSTWLVPLAVVCGIASGLFSCGYLLSDLLAPGSRLLILLTVALSILGAAAFYVLFRWAAGLLRKLAARGQLGAVCVSLALAAILFFGGTSRWRSSARYIPFVLPSHHLTVSYVLPRSPVARQPDIRLSWFSTSLGDVSYDTVRLTGWKRIGDELVLQDSSHNSLEWQGRTGEAAQLVFRSSGAAGKLTIAWDTDQEQLPAAGGKFTYQRSLYVPWYASRTVVLILGVLTFAALLLPLTLLLWERRHALADSIGDALALQAVRLEKLDAAFVLAAAALALLLRLPNLGVPFPAVDEYFHLDAARQLVQGAALSSVYQRGLWLVTVPVSLSLRLFGYEFWAARVVGVLFNVLAILPLYLLTIKINRPVAALSTILYATSPWIVTFARIAREYAFYPFYFYWIAFGMVSLISWVPHGAVLPRDGKQIFTPTFVLTAFLLCLPPLFALYGDRLSTFRTILLAYPVFVLFLLGRFDLRNRSNIPFLVVLGGGFLFITYGWFERQGSKIVPFPRYNSVPVEYFLPNPQQQWYFDRLALLAVIGLVAVAVSSILVIRRNFVPGFLIALYAAFVVFFAFFSESFFHTRHLLTTELWYIAIAATGLYLVWRVLAGVVPGRAWLTRVAMAAALGVAVFNLGQVASPALSTNPDNPISEDYLHDLTPVQAYMVDHAAPTDALISTVYGLYSSWKGEPQFVAQYRITTQTPREDILALMEQHESGWIVIDQIRLTMSGLGPHAFAGIPGVEFAGQFGDEYVWRWQHAPAGAGSLMIVGKE